MQTEIRWSFQEFGIIFAVSWRGRYQNQKSVTYIGVGGIKIRRVFPPLCSLFMQLYKMDVPHSLDYLNVHEILLIRRKLCLTVRRFDFNLAMESVHVWAMAKCVLKRQVHSFY